MRPLATHCGRGHEYTEANTIVRASSKGRMCRECQNHYRRENRRRKSGADPQPQPAAPATEPAANMPPTWLQPDPARLKAEQERRRAKAALGQHTLRDATVGVAPQPPSDDQREMTRRLLERHSATELAEMLGVAS
ncbi:MAG: hypothetical protein KBB39_17590 [Phycicoccus sp.]|nr:hypothetical protein [Phycicoccus sp.]